MDVLRLLWLSHLTRKKLSWLNILSGSEFTAESEMLVVIHYTLQVKKMTAYLHHLQKFRCLFNLRTSKPRYFKMPSRTPHLAHVFVDSGVGGQTLPLVWHKGQPPLKWTQFEHITDRKSSIYIPSVGKTDPKLGTKEFQRNWAPKIPKRSNLSKFLQSGHQTEFQFISDWKRVDKCWSCSKQQYFGDKKHCWIHVVL